MRKLITRVWTDIAIQFAIIAFGFGMMFSFAVIPWQTPDETAHLQFIGQEIKNENLANVFMGQLDLDFSRIAHNTDQSVDRAKLKMAMFSSAQYDRKDVLLKGISIQAVRHLPAIVGIQLGCLFHLPVYWVLQLGEFTALLFYIFVGYWILKIVPYKKRLFELVMLIPMGLHQAASLNYDAVLLPMCYLFVAYILYLQNKERIQWKNILILVLILGVIFVTKIPYVVLGLLVLTLPFERMYLFWGNKRDCALNEKIVRPILVVMMVAGIGGFLLLYRESFYVRILMACITNPVQTMHLFKATLDTFLNHLVTSFVGTFGWLDTFLFNGIPYMFVTFMLFVAMNLDDASRQTEGVIKRIGKGTKVCLFSSGIVIVLFVTMSMIAHTFLMIHFGCEDHSIPVDYQQAIYQIPYIGGLQGRYYLPAALPILLCLPQAIEMEEKKYKILLILVMAFLFIACVNCLWMRYFA